MSHDLLCVVTAAEPPRVLTPADTVYQVIRNNPALLDCSVFGSPIPNITWYVPVRNKKDKHDMCC